MFCFMNFLLIFDRFSQIYMTPNVEMETETVLLKIRNILMIFKSYVFHLSDTFLYQFGIISIQQNRISHGLFH